MQIDKFQVYIIRKAITKNGKICDVKEVVIIYLNVIFPSINCYFNRYPYISLS